MASADVTFITKLGKDNYETSAEAEADVKLLCKESNAKPVRDPGSAE